MMYRTWQEHIFLQGPLGPRIISITDGFMMIIGSVSVHAYTLFISIIAIIQSQLSPVECFLSSFLQKLFIIFLQVHLWEVCGTNHSRKLQVL